MKEPWLYGMPFLFNISDLIGATPYVTYIMGLLNFGKNRMSAFIVKNFYGFCLRFWIFIARRNT